MAFSPVGAPLAAPRQARGDTGATADRVELQSAPDRLRDAYRRAAAEAPGGAAGVRLDTTSAERAAIASGAHQVRVVDGQRLAYPSQVLAAIESSHPDEPGQTHALERHVGTTLADNVARLEASPLLHAVGSFDSAADAQFATDRTIANPANQRAIGAFLADTGRLKTALARVDLGRRVGTTTVRSDLLAGAPALIPGSTATVVLIKDPSFPEGYRVLTTYPDTRPPDVDRRGSALA
jgi:hypothetical protein